MPSAARRNPPSPHWPGEKGIRLSLRVPSAALERPAASPAQARIVEPGIVSPTARHGAAARLDLLGRSPAALVAALVPPQRHDVAGHLAVTTARPRSPG